MLGLESDPEHQGRLFHESMPMRLNKQQLAQHFNVALKTVDNWVTRGCPAEKVGAGWALDPVSVQVWLEQRDNETEKLDLMAQRAKLDRARAEKTELAVLQERAKVVQLDVVTAYWLGVKTRALEILTALPGQAAHQLSSVHTYPETASILKNIIHETLEKLRDGGIPDLNTQAVHRLINDSEYTIPQPDIPDRQTEDLNLSEQRARLAKAQTDRTELAILQERAQMVEISVVVEYWYGLIASAKASLLSLPGRVAHELLAVGTGAEKAVILKRLIDQTLAELNNDGIPKEYVERISQINASLESAS